MAQVGVGSAWVDVLDGPLLPSYLPALTIALEATRDHWLPYQTTADVLRRVEDGEYHVWVGGLEDTVEIWGITELRVFNNCRTLTVVWCSGINGEQFFDLWISVLEDFVKAMHIDRIVITGRKGWERIFKPHGYRFASIELVKDFDHGRKAAEQSNTDE